MWSIMVPPILVTAVRFLSLLLDVADSILLLESWLEMENKRFFFSRFATVLPDLAFPPDFLPFPLVDCTIGAV